MLDVIRVVVRFPPSILHFQSPPRYGLGRGNVEYCQASRVIPSFIWHTPELMLCVWVWPQLQNLEHYGQYRSMHP